MDEHIEQLKAKRRYASVLMTYSCTIACEHCCFACAPREPAAVTPVEDAVGYLAEYYRLDRLIHIAGGEPFRYWKRLRDIVRAARERGVAPHFVETNCSWCKSDAIARERFEELKAHGVLWLLISTDLYHLRLVPVERVHRGIRIAEDVFGEGTTMGLTDADELEQRASVARDETAWHNHISKHPPMLVGRAAEVFAQHLDPKPADSLHLETGWGLDPDNTCAKEWDPLWEIHVDPYGNVQTNCGIILGNANEVPVSELMASWPQRNPVLERISQRGVAALLDMAVERGFGLEDAYPQKCYLCLKLRTFLRARGSEFRTVFGPDEVYGTSA